ncbi:3-hydroxyacyl-CoA dehydrogenase NAD-binding domain-containing protein, partial [Oleiphilus sp. HI0079]|uniref:3-hydroxyacyl-CoA dehydrogenase NAD-binding domain-containing protein n=2 Tax=Oleiphilus TaxID=141450 RepID=UPI001E54D611
MKKVVVIGAGTMGAGIAQTFAVSGLQVVLKDVAQEAVERGIATIEKGLSRLVSKEKITQAEANAVMSNITGVTDNSTVADADLIVEAAVENMAIKKQIFAELDAVCGQDTIFATNTSSLSITEVAAATTRPDRFLGMHFFNPAPVMKLVELIKGIATSEETFA